MVAQTLTGMLFIAQSVGSVMGLIPPEPLPLPKTVQAPPVKRLKLKPTIDRFPNAVLLEIFIHACGSHYFPVEIGELYTAELAFYRSTPVVHVSPNSATTPFTLAQICQRWRNIALDPKSAELWRTITLVHPNERHVFRLRQWLYYSRDWSLHIRILQSPEDSDTSEGAAAVYDLLGAHAYRWRRISFGFLNHVPRALARHVAALLKFSSPRLHSVHLLFHQDVEGSDKRGPAERVGATEFVELFEGLKSLREFRLYQPFQKPALWRFSAKLDHLMLLHPYGLDDIAGGLDSYQSLKSLRIYLSEYTYPAQRAQCLSLASRCSITLESLTSLFLSMDASVDDIVLFFKYLTVPELKQLVLVNPLYYIIQGASLPLFSAISEWHYRRSHTPLENLVLSIPALEMNYFIDALPQFSSLAVLIVSQAIVEPAFLASLIAHSPNAVNDSCEAPPETNLPNLVELELGICMNQPTPDSELVEMLCSRLHRESWYPLTRAVVTLRTPCPYVNNLVLALSLAFGSSRTLKVDVV